MSWNLVLFQMSAAAAEGSHHGPVTYWDHPIFRITSMVTAQWAIIAILLVVGFLAGRNVQKHPKGLQTVFEMLFEFLENWWGGFIGSKAYARKYLPLLGTFFLFILVSNYSGALPGAGTIFMPPTGLWGTTLGLGVCVMISSQAVAIREQGLGPYLKGFLGPAPGLLSLIMAPLTIMEEFVKPFSLSLRLWGNIFAEEQLLAGVFGLMPLVAPIPIMGLGLLFGAIQAVVFSTLAASYLGSAIHGH